MFHKWGAIFEEDFFIPHLRREMEYISHLMTVLEPFVLLTVCKCAPFQNMMILFS